MLFTRKAASSVRGVIVHLKGMGWLSRHIPGQYSFPVTMRYSALANVPHEPVSVLSRDVDFFTIFIFGFGNMKCGEDRSYYDPYAGKR